MSLEYGPVLSVGVEKQVALVREAGQNGLYRTDAPGYTCPLHSPAGKPFDVVLELMALTISRKASCCPRLRLTDAEQACIAFTQPVTPCFSCGSIGRMCYEPYKQLRNKSYRKPYESAHAGEI